MAVIDLAGFVIQLKDHAVEHGFHIHDERHFVETYSLRQSWEVDLHPEQACNGPLDLHLALEVDPRVLLGFEDTVSAQDPDADPPEGYALPLTFNWSLPPIEAHVDMLRLTLDLAGLGGIHFPVEVSAVDSYPSVTEAPSRRLGVQGKYEVSLAQVYLGEEIVCETLDLCSKISEFLLERAVEWLGQP